ncbi:hypothetical protein ACJX0J_039929, partial [Zea mays]
MCACSFSISRLWDRIWKMNVEMITVTGIIKYIADVVLLYFEALLLGANITSYYLEMKFMEIQWDTFRKLWLCTQDHLDIPIGSEVNTFPVKMSLEDCILNNFCDIDNSNFHISFTSDIPKIEFIFYILLIFSIYSKVNCVLFAFIFTVVSLYDTSSRVENCFCDLILHNF